MSFQVYVKLRELSDPPTQLEYVELSRPELSALPSRPTSPNIADIYRKFQTEPATRPTRAYRSKDGSYDGVGPGVDPPGERDLPNAESYDSGVIRGTGPNVGAGT